MKVKIRKYPTWMGPFQLVEKLCFIKDELTQKQIEELEVILSSRISTMILENQRG